ncbi:MAG TPA: acylphosphatase [Reyranella sp.]|nr:acylphosphatase [Reyranella sp.]
MKAVRLLIVGRVQGVGYRDWVLRTARNLGLRGWVRNRTDGSVEVLIVGEEAAVSAMIEACRRGPAHARVDNVDVQPADLADVPESFTQLPTA